MAELHDVDIEAEFRQMEVDARSDLLDRLHAVHEELLADTSPTTAAPPKALPSAAASAKGLFGGGGMFGGGQHQHAAATQKAGPPSGNPFARNSVPGGMFEGTDGMKEGQGIFGAAAFPGTQGGHAPWTEEDVKESMEERKKASERKASVQSQAPTSRHTSAAEPADGGRVPAAALLVPGENFADFLKQESESALLTRNNCVTVESYPELSQKVQGWMGFVQDSRRMG